MLRVMRHLIPVILLLMGTAVAQQTCPVTVQATVVDRSGVVKGLQPADFVVKIGGREIPVASAHMQPPARIFLVLDASGSMGDLPQGPNPDWNLVLAQAYAIVSRAPQGTLIGFLSFGGRLEKRLDPTQDPNAVLQQILAARTWNPYGKTSLWDALDHAGALLKRGDAIVVLTDAGDSGSGESESKLEKSLALRGIRVYAILVANHTPHTQDELLGGDNLASLVKGTGGQLFRLDQVKLLLQQSKDPRSALESFADQLWALADSYVLTVDSPAVQKPEKLSISLQGNARNRKDLRMFHAKAIAGCEALTSQGPQ